MKNLKFFLLVLTPLLAACNLQRRAVRQFEKALSELADKKAPPVVVVRHDTVALPMVFVDSVLIREDCPERDSFTVADAATGVTTTVRHERLPEGRRRFDVQTTVPADTIYLTDTLRVQCPPVVNLPMGGKELPWGWLLAFLAGMAVFGVWHLGKKKSPA